MSGDSSDSIIDITLIDQESWNQMNEVIDEKKSEEEEQIF